MKNIFLLTGLWLCIQTVVVGQEAEDLSLEKAVEIGLEENFQVKIAVNDFAIVENERRILKGTALMPILDASYARTYSVEDVEQRFVSDPAPRTINNASADTENFSILGIYGFRPEAVITLRRLGKLTEISELEAKVVIENTVASISSAYYRLVLELQRYNVLKKTLELSEERLEIARAQYEFGRASKRDYLAAQVDYNSDLSLVVNQEQVIQNSRINLNELLALPPTRDFAVNDTIIIEKQLFLEDLVENAYTDNKQLLITQRQENVAYLELKELQAQRLPSLTLNANYVNNTLNSEAGFLLQNKRDGYNFGATVNLNLFSGFSLNRRIQNAKIQKTNQEFALNQYEIQLTSDIHRTYNTYLNSKRLLEIDQRNYEVAIENSEIALERFRLGIASYLEFRDAQVNRLGAENGLITSLFNIKEMEIELMRLAGKIFFQNSYEKIR